MHARVVQLLLTPGTTDQVVTYFRDTVGPALKQHEGFKNSRLLTNPTTNQCLMVTLWESDVHRAGGETSGFLQDVLGHIGAYAAGAPSIDYYEVSVQVV